MLLLSPVGVGHLELPHRVIMGSMHLGLEEQQNWKALAACYVERVRGGVGLVVTGGISPNHAGRPIEHGAVLTPDVVAGHRIVTDAVHEAGGRIIAQLLHFGRYAKHAEPVGPSAVPTPINPVPVRALTADEVEATIADFGRAAALAMQAGYDGVEVMGSEGYLLNTFTAPGTNLRTDAWGGSADHRRRFPVAVVRAVRQATGDGLLSYRLSVLDLVPGGGSLSDAVELAREVADAGADLIVTGIGWHESRVPTIASPVPHAAFTAATRAVKDAVAVPVAATNRINDPVTANDVLERGDADLICLARPLLADPDFVAKATRPERVNTCIGCNQSCLDHAMTGRLTSCLVNPRAGRERSLVLTPVVTPRRVAVVGAGPGGLAAAVASAERGHRVTLFEAEDAIGGQFQLARRVPGKEDYAETIRYFSTRLRELGVDVRLGRAATVADLLDADEVVLATGVRPRVPDIDGIDHPIVRGYGDVLRGAPVGERVAIIGAGGIGFDVATFLLVDAHEDLSAWQRRWGIDLDAPGGLGSAVVPAPTRQVTLLQRRSGKPGANLGPTTGWIHRAELAARGVRFLTGVTYRRVDDAGLHVTIDGRDELVAADTVINCSGQEPLDDLAADLAAAGVQTHLIGGARLAAELDAARAIREATELAATL